MSTLASLNLSLQSSVSFFSNGKGGVGKSTCAQSFIENLMDFGFDPAIAQVDVQGRLSALNDREVLTIGRDPKAIREKPELELMRFDPLSDLVVDTPQNRPIVVDLAAGEEKHVANWCRQVDFNVDLEEANRHAIVFIVFTSEQESIELAGETARIFKGSIRGASYCFVENQRFGKIEDLVRGSPAQLAHARCVVPHLADSYRITMPPIGMNSYAHFEQSRIPFGRVEEMTIPELIAATGLKRAYARAVQGDVAFWNGHMADEFARIFGGPRDAS